MTSFLRFIEMFALGTWVGGIVYLSFIIAPGAFTTLASRDQAGTLVGLFLSRLHFLGLIAGAIYLLAAWLESKSFTAWVRPAALVVILMMAVTFASQHFVSTRMRALRTEMVSVDATPRDNPLRAEFDHLHRISVRLESTVLLLGLVSLFLTIRGYSARQ